MLVWYNYRKQGLKLVPVSKAIYSRHKYGVYIPRRKLSYSEELNRNIAKTFEEYLKEKTNGKQGKKDY